LKKTKKEEKGGFNPELKKIKKKIMGRETPIVIRYVKLPRSKTRKTGS